MPSLSPDGELQRLTATAYTPQDDVHERLKALALQMTLECQRQRDQVEEELHKLSEQLVTMAREHQHQATLATVRETTEALRKDVADALHRLSQDTERVAQHAEAQTSRAVEQLRNELLATLFERDCTIVQGHMLGELLVTLGRQLQEADKEETS